MYRARYHIYDIYIYVYWIPRRDTATVARAREEAIKIYTKLGSADTYVQCLHIVYTYVGQIRLKEGRRRPHPR